MQSVSYVFEPGQAEPSRLRLVVRGAGGVHVGRPGQTSGSGQRAIRERGDRGTEPKGVDAAALRHLRHGRVGREDLAGDPTLLLRRPKNEAEAPSSLQLDCLQLDPPGHASSIVPTIVDGARITSRLFAHYPAAPSPVQVA
jgi:hypothetical protein